MGNDCINIPSSVVPVASPRISSIHGSGSAGSSISTVAAVPAICSSSAGTPLPPPTIEFPPPPPRNQDIYIAGTSSNSSTATQCNTTRDVRDTAVRMKAVQHNLPLPIPPSSTKPKLHKLG